MSARFNLCAYTHYAAARRLLGAERESDAQAIGYALALLFAIRKQAATKTKPKFVPRANNTPSEESAPAIDETKIVVIGGERLFVENGRAVVLFGNQPSKIVGTATMFTQKIIVPNEWRAEVDNAITNTAHETLRTRKVFDIYKQLRDKLQL